ncbi:MAG: hypothetical protein GYA21_05575 [Myxococcales bacterium]|nr:hypothetical protein [Myxococcales bacterium]
MPCREWKRIVAGVCLVPALAWSLPSGAQEASPLDLSLAPLSSGGAAEALKPPEPLRTVWGRRAFFTGLALIGFGVLSLVVAKGAAGEYDRTGITSDRDRAESWAGIMFASFGAGAALAVAGAVLWFAPRSDDGAFQAALAPGPEGRGLSLGITARW